MPDAGLQVYAIWLSSRPDKMAQPGAPYFMPDAARAPYPGYSAGIEYSVTLLMVSGPCCGFGRLSAASVS
ncbi:hypothetical protein DYR53_19155 [Escherichia coli]|nr:hypothetical protein [Escherichia coli]EFO0649274.1 hypothetical protein [Escherichia coli]EFO0690434.1 hypothetical protein [Escherichia coli]